MMTRPEMDSIIPTPDEYAAAIAARDTQRTEERKILRKALRDAAKAARAARASLEVVIEPPSPRTDPPSPRTDSPSRTDPSPRTDPWTASVLKLLKHRDGLCCWLCGYLIQQDCFSIDHVIPKSMGGSDHTNNLRLAHKKCNNTRGNRPPAEGWVLCKFYALGFDPFLADYDLAPARTYRYPIIQTCITERLMVGMSVNNGSPRHPGSDV